MRLSGGNLIKSILLSSSLRVNINLSQTSLCLTHYRGLFTTLVLLPASALYSAYTSTRNLIVFRLKSVPDKHDESISIEV